jgi:hypothetical protein
MRKPSSSPERAWGAVVTGNPELKAPRRGRRPVWDMAAPKVKVERISSPSSVSLYQRTIPPPLPSLLLYPSVMLEWTRERDRLHRLQSIEEEEHEMQ